MGKTPTGKKSQPMQKKAQREGMVKNGKKGPGRGGTGLMGTRTKLGKTGGDDTCRKRRKGNPERYAGKPLGGGKTTGRGRDPMEWEG